MSLTIVEHLALWPVKTLEDASLRGLRDVGRKWLEKNANPTLRACAEYMEVFGPDIQQHIDALNSIERELHDRAR
jgi:ABC-type transporter Mla subunit MlaD